MRGKPLGAVSRRGPVSFYLQLSPPNVSRIMRRGSIVSSAVAMAAAALTSSALLPQSRSFVHAFSVHPVPLSPKIMPSRIHTLRPYHTSTTTTLAARNGSGGGGGFLEKLRGVAKAILPSGWFQSDDEKRAAIERKRQTAELQTSVREMLADAPLPVRMLGGLAARAAAGAMSGLAETFREQQATVDALLDQAERSLRADRAVVDALGAPLQVSRQPFSQSSSTTSINGRTASNTQLAFSVSGSRQSGVVQLLSDGNMIQQLVVQVGGRVMQVSATPVAKDRNVRQRRQSNDNDIIEAEIIEKETKRK